MLLIRNMITVNIHKLASTDHQQENALIRFRLTELITDMSLRTGERVDLADVANATGIHRTTLSKINNVRGYNMTTSNIDRLCKFFSCTVGDLLVYVPDEDVSGPINRSYMGPTANSTAAGAGAAARHANKSKVF